MAETYTNSSRCFLCRRKQLSAIDRKAIESSLCPASKKTVKQVLLHLAHSANTELHIPREKWICTNCYLQLSEYDAALVKLLRKQRNLSQLVEKAVVDVDSDYERECDDHMATLEELNNEHFFDDIQISETEIDQTMTEALGNKHENESTNKTHEHFDVRRCRTYDRELSQCTFCAMRFKSKLRLQKHISQAHKKFSCDLCSFSHRNEDYVILHMNIHEGRNENQCRYCDKVFTTKISTIRHMEVHLDSKKYQCDKCGLCFSQTTVLYNHKLQHEAEEKPLHCDICSQVFKTKRTYRHHMITHRADRPRHSCEHCGKTFTEKYTLKVHKRTHTDTNPSSSTDPEQQQQQQHQEQQQEQEALSTVAQTSSTTENKYNCIICDQPFTIKDHLNKHMEKEHDVILKSLTLTNFTQYEVIPYGPKRPCHICGHMFSTQANLDGHLEQVHGLSFK